MSDSPSELKKENIRLLNVLEGHDHVINTLHLEIKQLEAEVKHLKLQLKTEKAKKTTNPPAYMVTSSVASSCCFEREDCTYNYIRKCAMMNYQPEKEIPRFSIWGLIAHCRPTVKIDLNLPVKNEDPPPLLSTTSDEEEEDDDVDDVDWDVWEDDEEDDDDVDCGCEREIS